MTVCEPTIRKVHVLSSNLSGHTNFCDKWFRSYRSLKNRKNQKNRQNFRPIIYNLVILAFSAHVVLSEACDKACACERVL